MSWRYENYGTADLLTVSAETIETPNSKYGFAYRFFGWAYFGIPKTAKEIWAKCNAYFTSDYSDGNRIGIEHRLSDGSDCGFWSHSQSITNNCWLFVNEKTASREISGSAFAKDSFHTFLLHMKSDSSNGIIELWIDGNSKYKFSGSDVNHGNSFDNFFISTANSILISNIIISNEEIGLYENVSLDRLGLRETPLLFNREKILAGYNLDEISNSLFRYNAAVKSLADLLLDRLKVYEDSKQSVLQKFSSITMQAAAKYVQNPNLTDAENGLLETRQKFFSQAFKLGMDDVKNKILNVKAQIERLERRIDEINSSENSLAELQTLRYENRADFKFVMENFLDMIEQEIAKLNFFDKHETTISILMDAQEKWTNDYKAFKTNLREELAAACRNESIDEEIFTAWYDDWQLKRFTIEQRFLPLVEFTLKGNFSDAFNRVLENLQAYRDSFDKFYLNERKNIYQKFAFQAGGDLQEKFETESELYKLTEKLQRDLQTIIFSCDKTEERIFLLNWSEPLLNLPIDEISNFIRDKNLDAISEEVLTQFAEIKRQNFATYLADSQAYGEAVQKREKEFNALIFRMRKDLHKS
ncbi:MAG: hypothetical protein IKI76_03640 [Selenomonadaceae bacterium]|nr:hypothetical protein [Selenomonadaceae bacterium]